MQQGFLHQESTTVIIALITTHMFENNFTITDYRVLIFGTNHSIKWTINDLHYGMNSSK